VSVIHSAVQGGEGGVDTGDNIPYSLMLGSGASQYLSRTFGAPTSTTKRFILIWKKRTKLSTYTTPQTLLACSSERFWTDFEGADYLGAYIGGASCYSTTKLRDVIGWEPYILSIDTTQVTAANRVQIYRPSVSGATPLTLIGSFPAQNHTLVLGSAVVHAIGWQPGTGYPDDGYYATPILLDGKCVQDGSVAITDVLRLSADTGQWVNKAYSGTYGNNGFKLEFADPSFATYGLGKDTSGNNNHWTPNGGITSANQYTDTPTSNSNVLNILNHNGASSLIAKKGNLTADNTGAGTVGRLTTSIPLTSGKWQFEVTRKDALGIGNCMGYGVVDSSAALSTGIYIGAPTNTGASVSEWMITDRAVACNTSTYTDLSGTLGTIGQNDVTRVFIDMDNKKIWFGKNGTISGDPTAGTGAAFSNLPASVLVAHCASAFSGLISDYNFGAKATAYSAHPTFKQINTANLPTPAILKSSNGVVAVTATEANIAATLASARSGWSDYVEILKNRSAAESWAHRFSHDSGNEYAVSVNSVTRQATRALSGTDAWSGWGIRVGATYGTAAGSIAHTNGAATTITHNVGKSARQLILLFPRAGGSTIKMYHPNLDAGKLLNFCGVSGQTTDSSIASVTANSFQIGSGMATGTYDYLVCSEITGFFKLWEATGNDSTDGPYTDLGLSPVIDVTTSTTSNSVVARDAARNPHNVMNYGLWMNASDTETVNGYLLDRTAGGRKTRSSGESGTNAAGTKYVGFTWGDPINTATAR